MQDLNDKITGDTLTATEWNEVPSELQNVIEDTGQALSSGDLNQLGKGIAQYSANGDFYTDTGVADAYDLSVIGGKQISPAYVDGMRIRFIPGNVNTGASTVNVSGLGVKNIKDENGNPLGAGRLNANNVVIAVYNLSAGEFRLEVQAAQERLFVNSTQDPFKNLVIKNTVANPNFQVDIDSDFVELTDSNGSKILLDSINLTADITASGANGLDTGVEAISTQYHIWIIYDGTTVSALLSLSATAPTLPGGYTYKGYYGSIYNDSGSNFISLHQINDRASLSRTSVLSGGTATSATPVSLSAAGIPSTAKEVFGDANVGTGGAVIARVSSTAGELGAFAVTNDANTAGTQFSLALIESQTIYYLVGGSDELDVQVAGWRF